MLQFSKNCDEPVVCPYAGHAAAKGAPLAPLYRGGKASDDRLELFT